MNTFGKFLLEHLPATIIALVGFVGSIASIWETVHNHIKRGKRQYFLIGILVLIFILSILYLSYQYSVSLKSSAIPQQDAESATAITEEEDSDLEADNSSLPENEDSSDSIQNIDVDESVTASDNSENDAQSAENGGAIVDAPASTNSGNVIQAGGSNVSNDGDHNAIVNGPGVAVSGNGNTIVVDGEKDHEIPVTVSSVVLNKSQIDLCVGDSCTLIATVLYSDNSQNNQVTWISSDETVVKVEDGQISALSPGTAKITAQASINNSAKDASCTVSVAAPPSGYSISLSTYKTTLGSPFYIYITPYDDNITNINVYAKSPSGNIDTYALSDTGRYLIDTEVGVWTIYASVENQAGTYEASSPHDFVTIEITPMTFDSIFPGIG